MCKYLFNNGAHDVLYYSEFNIIKSKAPIVRSFTQCAIPVCMPVPLFCRCLRLRQKYSYIRGDFCVLAMW